MRFVLRKDVFSLVLLLAACSPAACGMKSRLVKPLSLGMTFISTLIDPTEKAIWTSG